MCSVRVEYSWHGTEMRQLQPKSRALNPSLEQKA